MKFFHSRLSQPVTFANARANRNWLFSPPTGAAAPWSERDDRRSRAVDRRKTSRSTLPVIADR